MQRTTEVLEEEFGGLETHIKDVVLPAIIGRPITSIERDLFSLPTRYGGLGVKTPAGGASDQLGASRIGTRHLSECCLSGTGFDKRTHQERMDAAKREHHQNALRKNKEQLEVILPQVESRTRRAIERAVEGHTSSWLTAVPTAENQFDLSQTEFRDSIALRYHMPLAVTPENCDGCGAPFSLDHALQCKTGGLVTKRHNEIRDALGDLASLAWGRQVIKEPVVREADESGTGQLKADLLIRGVWEPQTQALLDVRVTDTDAASRRDHKPRDVVSRQEDEKKKLLNEECLKKRSTFTPFVVSVDGMLAEEAKRFVQAIARRLTKKWAISYSKTMGWVRTRLAFSILRATNLCLRGSRVRWRSLGIEDGVGVLAIGT
eukprot:GHVN01033520.1.p1 GENE.GHVN01033520.1~~GHVN01033520.1.p1  ORF type:complete len:376 (+),score=31.07 GHVN01033520.1:296-1423(+)